jgi:hypothetical protein
MKISTYFIILLFACFSINSFAQEQETRTTRLDFEDELISGDVSSPDLLLILRNKNPDYGRLLKLRDNFLPELRETRYEVVRGEND